MKERVKDELKEMFRKYQSLPILFAGAGISQRYLGLPNWEGLLRYLAKRAKDVEFSFETYKNRANNSNVEVGEFPKIAEFIEKDLGAVWFEDDRYKEIREKYKDEIVKGTSPIKIEIGNYIENNSSKLNPEMKKEVELLKKVGKRSIAGVITTNYDNFLENTFENYTTFIGQEELIFSQIQGVGEIYKIHGCCTKPNSIIINEKDYIGFREKNQYLASKILTLFLEHPIIFIGYSISDQNIRDILKAIVGCLSKEKLNTLKERFIFIEWDNTEKDGVIATHTISFEDGKSINMTKITLSNYDELFEAILENKAKYNTPMLRNLKKDIYDLVLTNEPTEKMKVVGLEDDDKLENVEVVIGVGVISELGKKGYETFTAEEIYKDIVYDNRNFDAKMVVKSTLPNLLKQHSKSIPIYKYICKTRDKLPQIVMESVKENYDEFLNTTLRNMRNRCDFSDYSIPKLIHEYGDMKSLQYIVLLDYKKIDIDELNKFLKHILDEYSNLLSDGKQNDRTNLKRLIRIYDWLKYYKNR